MSRPPTEQESQRWTIWRAKTETVISKGQALVLLAKVADKMQVKIEQLTAASPSIITELDAGIVNEIGRRAKILNELITAVLLRVYCVRFANGEIQIVSEKEEVDPADVYPSDEIDMGVAPILVVAAIAAATLLIAGDQAVDRLNQQIELERVKLQSKMIDADQNMAKQPADIRSQWESWKKSNFKKMQQIAADNPIAKSWLEKLIGKGGTSTLAIGAIALGALAVWLRSRR